MQEKETKFFVQDLQKIETRLQKLEAFLIKPRIYEKNLRFDLADHSLSQGRRVLRLRLDDKTRLTYKGASEKVQRVLIRQEIELVVDDYDQARAFLEALGYEKLFFYEKYRTTYAYQDTQVMLDELPYGNFIEIEGADLAAIQAAAKGIGLAWENSIPSSYQQLFERVCQGRNLTMDGLTFENFKNLKISPQELGAQAADD